jgi:hypothetical protein
MSEPLSETAPSEYGNVLTLIGKTPLVRLTRLPGK